MKDIKKAALWGGLVAAGTVMGLACYVYYLGKKTDTKCQTQEFVYHRCEELKNENAESVESKGE